MAASTVSTFSGAVERLKQMRNENIRHSDKVMDLWSDYISDNINDLGADKWLILEQIFIASLDVGEYSIAGKLFTLIQGQFSDSNRLKRLQGMYMEAREQYDKAEHIYSKILENDPVDFATQKRMVALYKTQGKIADAVSALNKYLEVSCMDFEGWMELSELYLSQADYEKAAFCVEELILNNPNNHLFHQRYAEIKYSQGDFELARVYFSQASKLSSSNVRALYGIVLCSQKLAASKSKSKVEHISIARKAIVKLDDQFKKAKSGTQSIHEAAMNSLLDSLV